MVDTTTVGVSPATRDAVKAYRDEHGLASCERAIKSLLESRAALDEVPEVIASLFAWTASMTARAHSGALSSFAALADMPLYGNDSARTDRIITL